METLERMPFEARKAVFKKLLEVANVENMTPEERYCYDESLKAYRDYYNTIASAERISREKGQAEGKAEGVILVASNMKKGGIDLASIIKYTGLDEETIKAL